LVKDFFKKDDEQQKDFFIGPWFSNYEKSMAIIVNNRLILHLCP
jgi:hypothetical protein